MRLFFYGTMMDPDVRCAVLGDRAAAALALAPATLAGYRRVLAKHGRYPVLVRRAAGRVEGLLASALTRQDLLRIAHFEGPNYGPARALVRTAGRARIAAWSLMPVRPADARDEAWDLRRWQLREKRRLLAELAAWMKEYERLGAHSVDIAWPVRRLLANPALFEDG